MATRYHSFNVFMNDVIYNADNKIKSSTKGVSGLEDLFELTNADIVGYIIKIISKGWWVFIAVTAILILGPIGFAGALLGFLSTPPGLIIGAVFGVSAFAMVKELYRNKKLPLAVADVGKLYKPKWEAIEGNHDKIDSLLDEATVSLINKASNAQRYLIDETFKNMN